MRCNRLTVRHRHIHYCLGDVNGVKDEREVLEILLASIEVRAYPEIVKIHISPIDISITPSSQPKSCQPFGDIVGCIQVRSTFDDLANANLCCKRTTAFGRAYQRHCLLR